MGVNRYGDENRDLNHSDEIDLITLFSKIWAGKFIIMGFIIVSAIISLIILLNLPSYYHINATVDSSRAEQLRPMWPATLENKAYQVPSNALQAPMPIFDGKEYQVPIPDEKKIYSKVLLQADSFNILKSFWESKTGNVLDLSIGAQQTDDVKAFKRFFNSFLLEAPNPKTPEITARNISIEYQDAKEGVSLLNDYLHYLNGRAWSDQFNTMEASYLANLKALDRSYESRNLIEQSKLNDEIIKLRENLKIAESLSIKETPFRELENIQLKILDSRDYLLGTRTLSQQLEILISRQGKPLAPFVSDLRSMEVWKNQITGDLQRIKGLNGTVNLFAVVNDAQSSIDPVKPKKTLIFIAVIFISGLIGVFYVLIMSVIQSTRNGVVR